MKKIKIRHNVFETNSSSSHSISIADENKPFIIDELLPDEDGVIEIHEDEFGWEWFKTNDAATKAAYAYIQTNRSDIVPDLIKEITGAEEVRFYGDGYVDHDSWGIVQRDEIWLKNFIFNKNSWLFGGNDNGSAEIDFYDVPYYDEKGEMHEVKYTHKVYAARKTLFKLKENFTNEDVEELLENYFVDQGHYLSESFVIKLGYDREYGFQSVNFDTMTLKFEKSPYHELVQERRKNTSAPLSYLEIKREADELVKKYPEKYIKEIPFFILEIND